MHDSTATAVEDEWVVWNGAAGILLTASLGRVEGRQAWLARPFDMVGPFDIDALKRDGCIHFEACMVMSRERWQLDQTGLRQQAFEQRRAAQERINAEYGDSRGFDEAQNASRFSDREHREALNLPGEGRLDASQIKSAFRKLAQKAHPDTGGSHEAFVRLTEARDALLERAA